MNYEESAQTPTRCTRDSNNQRSFAFGDSVSNEVVSATGELIQSVYFYFNGEICIYSVNDGGETSVLGPGFFFFSSRRFGDDLQWFLHCLMHPQIQWLATSHASIIIVPQ